MGRCERVAEVTADTDIATSALSQWAETEEAKGEMEQQLKRQSQEGAAAR